MDVVTFSTRPAANGKTIAIATLNSERSLNALSLPMVELLEPKLKEWRDDPSVACVWLEGAGEKAFCAGGDIVAMYQAMQDRPGQVVSEVEDFFTREYQLDYLIQTFPKPFIVWGHGIVMGGGMGLMNGASHRIVTESTRMAMPEVTIGLYPDVGGTYFLNRMPDKLGLFMGLTGASMNASDALFLKLADHFVPFAEKEALLENLQEISWGDTESLNKQKLTDTLSELQQQHTDLLPRGAVKGQLDSIGQALNGDSIDQVVSNILAIESDDKWLTRAQGSLRNGCPMTAHLVWNQLQHGAKLSLAECFQLELTLSVNCAVKGDFSEGIRALLIDKDNQPKWSYPSVAEVPAEAVDAMFMSPWGDNAHPLKDLAKE
ncbi:enoyl-CoA hydratase/isomerase family protein [Aliidiomarina soli]|uniref:3-hydroxyisobutyryl-CoA hydrolase n=1 Tax=Aliidiomarina soli TaxID=1928574 RepID=A0A432WLN5_9GAMM|nr:enoyl-CoA hydratase/isomerase family protein [Aliidiomarina soli]RUO34641.1 enoyl-CoA hydratase [Aliidiomarina soli]